jgi:hypothetical protein
MATTAAQADPTAGDSRPTTRAAAAMVDSG